LMKKKRPWKTEETKWWSSLSIKDLFSITWWRFSSHVQINIRHESGLWGKKLEKQITYQSKPHEKNWILCIFRIIWDYSISECGWWWLVFYGHFCAHSRLNRRIWMWIKHVFCKGNFLQTTSLTHPLFPKTLLSVLEIPEICPKPENSHFWNISPEGSHISHSTSNVSLNPFNLIINREWWPTSADSIDQI